MNSHIAHLAGLKRPNLLVRAARIGVKDFNRERSLRRIFEGDGFPGPGQAFDKLLELEASTDRARREGGAIYSPACHVELLTALINEAQLAALRLAA